MNPNFYHGILDPLYEKLSGWVVRWFGLSVKRLGYQVVWAVRWFGLLGDLLGG